MLDTTHMHTCKYSHVWLVNSQNLSHIYIYIYTCSSSIILLYHKSGFFVVQIIIYNYFLISNDK